jgi:hypothetical protein
MKERSEQNWETCKFSVGNLEFLNNENKLLRVIYPKKDWQIILKEIGINYDYYCSSSKLMRLNLYMPEGLSKKSKGYRSVAHLFSLYLEEDWNRGSDLLDGDRSQLKILIKNGLKMCGHCRFYEQKEIEKKIIAKEKGSPERCAG